MGTSHSTPGPLIDVYAPGSHWKVPYGSFAFEPQSISRSHHGPHTGGPIYTPCSSPRQRARPRNRRPRYNAADLKIPEGSEDSETELGEMIENMSPRGLRSQGTRAYPGAMGGVGGRGGVGYFDGMDARSRSVQEMPVDAYPGMYGMRMGMPSPGMEMKGMSGMGGMPGGMPARGGPDPGAVGGMGSMPPPEYTSNPSLRPGGMHDPGMNPYASYPGPQPSPPSSASPTQAQEAHHATRRPSKNYAHIPMGAYANAEKSQQPSRSRTEPQVSAQLNRGQSSRKKARPSGEEWTNGNAWLDACICTTNCKCRKSQRVLYRERRDCRNNGDSDDDGSEHQSGEIRFILKDDLGRDCGDHSGCKKSDSESENKSKKKGSRNKKERKKKEKHLESFKEDLLEALDDRLRDMKREKHQQGHPETFPQSLFGRPDIDPRLSMMNEANRDPQIAQQMRMVGGSPYMMGMSRTRQMPPEMTNPARHRRRGPLDMSTGGMAATGVDFHDDMSLQNIGPIGRGNPYASYGTMRKNSMRPEVSSPLRAKTGGRFGAQGMDMNITSSTLYGRAMEKNPLNERRPGTRSGARLQRPHVDFESDDFDIGHPHRPGIGRQRSEEDTAPRGMSDDGAAMS